MSIKLEYPLSMFFEQLEWAWRNWHFRPEDEEERWHKLVLHLSSEIRNYLDEQERERTASERSLKNTSNQLGQTSGNSMTSNLWCLQNESYQF